MSCMAWVSAMAVFLSRAPQVLGRFTSKVRPSRHRYKHLFSQVRPGFSGPLALALRDLLEVLEPRRTGGVGGHPPVAARTHRAAGGDLRSVGQRRALELVGEELADEDVEPLAHRREVVRRTGGRAESRRPLPCLRVAPGVP